MRDTVFVVHDGEGLAPVTLAGKQPVAQLVLDLADTRALRLQPLNGGGLGLIQGHAVEIQTAVISGINRRTCINESFLLDVATGHNLDNRQVELGRELVVAGVVRGHGHNRARAVAGQDIVGDEHRKLVPIDRVGGVHAKEHTRFVLILLALDIGLRCDCRTVGFYRFHW